MEDARKNFDESLVEGYLEDFLDKSRLGRDIDFQRAKFLKRSPSDSNEISEAYERARMMLGISSEKHKTGIFRRESNDQNWYSPQLTTDVYWPKLRKKIESELGDAVNSVDEYSTAVINQLRPCTHDQNTKGLVLGYVQSGKTTNFMSVIAKAADCDFRLIIVLTGMTESLRVQTQTRVSEYLNIKEEGNSSWHPLTNSEDDFSGKIPIQLNDRGTRNIAVVKKNSIRLQKLNEQLEKLGDSLNSCAILVIDDEADQASIDVSVSSKSKDSTAAMKNKAERSAINAQINNLLEHDKTAYVAYTATPFANILINPNPTEAKAQDLYPKDFIIPLPEPEGYFGSRALFGRAPLTGESLDEFDLNGFDMIRIIPEIEAEVFRPTRKANSKDSKNQPAGSIDREAITSSSKSLEDSIRWFILATAARWIRGQRSKHSSMLVHTSMRTDDHEDVKLVVQEIVRKLSASLSQDLDELETWRTLWEFECSRVGAGEFKNRVIDFVELISELPRVIETLEVVVDNSRTNEDRLVYEKNRPRTVIAIGGNTLSRGLTLEGLVSSYFVRRATAYDTLLQMGRWFGFRRGYEDLPRIWMTEELSTWFHQMATVEAELREELEVYKQERVTPLEVQARIRLMPGLSITARAKMQDARVREISFSDRKVQTIKFKETDSAWLKQNRCAVENLIRKIQKRGIAEEIGLYESPVFKGVHNSDILDFLGEYQIHEETRLGKNDAEMLRKYITKEADNKRIQSWNVSIISEQASSSAKPIDLGLRRPTNLISRAKLKDSEERDPGVANIKALITKTDRLNDIVLDSPDERAERRRLYQIEMMESSSQEYFLRKTRRAQIGLNKAHLAIYPIDRNSAPRKGADGRESLDAPEHILGIAIFFPKSPTVMSNFDYVSAQEPDQDLLDQYEDMQQEINTIRELDERQLEERSGNEGD